MTHTGPDCRHARLNIGADPQRLPDDVQAHVAGCIHCARFLDETRALDGRLRGALELPLEKFRAPESRPGWVPSPWKIAASLLLGLLVAGGVWLAGAPPALAGEVVEHIRHESASWGGHEEIPPASVAQVLQAAGVEFDITLPVVYASACAFHGRVVPHLVVQTAEGPLTVMLLSHEKVSRRVEFEQQGLHGVLLPAGAGSIAVLARGTDVPEPRTRQIVSGARW
jgi:hypothetical protein